MSTTHLNSPAKQDHSAPPSTQGSAPNPGASTPAGGQGQQEQQIPESLVLKHGLASEFRITTDALKKLGENLDLDKLLSWFSKPRPQVKVGDDLEMFDGLRAYFGLDWDRPNGACFYIRIH